MTDLLLLPISSKCILRVVLKIQILMWTKFKQFGIVWKVGKVRNISVQHWSRMADHYSPEFISCEWFRKSNFDVNEI